MHPIKITAVIIIAFAIVGCSDGARTFRIGEHNFVVPDQYVAPQIPGLPPVGKNGFVFLGSASDTADTFVASVESSARCANAEDTADLLRRACRRAKEQHEQPLDLSTVNKEMQAGGDVFWDYVERADDSSEVIASCWASTNERAGARCTYATNYKDLIVMVSFSDADVRRLPELELQVRRLLAAWETD